jgi:hypothetical protein
MGEDTSSAIWPVDALWERQHHQPVDSPIRKMAAEEQRTLGREPSAEHGADRFARREMGNSSLARGVVIILPANAGGSPVFVPGH